MTTFCWSSLCTVSRDESQLAPKPGCCYVISAACPAGPGGRGRVPGMYLWTSSRGLWTSRVLLVLIGASAFAVPEAIFIQSAMARAQCAEQKGELTA